MLQTLKSHPNIIELLFIYEWRDQYIFVFPFVERNLHDILHSNWSPPKHGTRNISIDSHWLWAQMGGVANALKTIHNPTDRGPDQPVIGFHFDLKPSNILVKEDGTLQITDFGQALLKSLEPGDLTYGIRRGGSITYQPPEASPTNISINSLDFGKTINQIHRSYDIWSLACIMFEVLVYLLGNGQAALQDFERERRNQPLEGAFYTATDPKRLKACVQTRLTRYRDGKISVKADRDYLTRILDLLIKMFDIDPRKRPASHEVYTKLKMIADGSDYGIAPEQQREVWKAQIPARVLEGYEELGWQSSTGLVSFLVAYVIGCCI